MSSPALLKVASGLWVILYGIVLDGASSFLQPVIGGSASWAVFIMASVVEMFGSFRVGSGMAYPTRWWLVLAVCLFVPLIGYIVLLVVASQGLKALRVAGAKVDLIGAWRQTIK